MVPPPPDPRRFPTLAELSSSPWKSTAPLAGATPRPVESLWRRHDAPCLGNSAGGALHNESGRSIWPTEHITASVHSLSEEKTAQTPVPEDDGAGDCSSSSLTAKNPVFAAEPVPRFPHRSEALKSEKDWTRPVIPGMKEFAVLCKTGRCNFHRWAPAEDNARPHDSEWYKTSVYSMCLRLEVDSSDSAVEEILASLELVQFDDLEIVDGGLLFSGKGKSARLRSKSPGVFHGRLGPFSPSKFSFVHNGKHVPFRLKLTMDVTSAANSDRGAARSVSYISLSPPIFVKSKKPLRVTTATGARRDPAARKRMQHSSGSEGSRLEMGAVLDISLDPTPQQAQQAMHAQRINVPEHNCSLLDRSTGVGSSRIWGPLQLWVPTVRGSEDVNSPPTTQWPSSATAVAGLLPRVCNGMAPMSRSLPPRSYFEFPVPQIASEARGGPSVLHSASLGGERHAHATTEWLLSQKRELWPPPEPGARAIERSEAAAAPASKRKPALLP